MSDVLGWLKSDEVHTNDLKLKLGRFGQGADQKTFRPGANASFTFNPPSLGETQPTEHPIATLGDFARIYELAGGTVSEYALERQWRSLPTPYRDWDDVLFTYFGHEMHQSGEHFGFVLFEARLPLWLDSLSGFHDGKMRILIRSATAVRNGLRLGIICRTIDELDYRLGIDGSRLRWRESGRKSLAVSVQPADKFRRSDIFLSFDGELIARLSRENFERKSDNHAIAVHQVFDEGLERFDRWLRGGPGGRSAQEFEQAIQWLLNFLGLKTVFYGGGGTENEIDILAEWTRGRILLAVECTTRTTDIGRKFTALHQRVGELLLRGRNWKVLPIVVTSLSPDKLTRTETERAYTDGIVLVTSSELADLREMALKCAEQRDVLEYLKRGGASRPSRSIPDSIFAHLHHQPFLRE